MRWGELRPGDTFIIDAGAEDDTFAGRTYVVLGTSGRPGQGDSERIDVTVLLDTGTQVTWTYPRFEELPRFDALIARGT